MYVAHGAGTVNLVRNFESKEPIFTLKCMNIIQFYTNVCGIMYYHSCYKLDCINQHRLNGLTTAINILKSHICIYDDECKKKKLN